MQKTVSGKVAENFGEYVITVDGGVYHGGERQHAWQDPFGYWKVRVKRLNRYREIRVSHLVASAWLGVTESIRRSETLAIWPRDGDASNHHAGNLVVIAQTGESIQFERDTRVKGGFDANQARNLRREWISRRKFWSPETNPPK